MFSALRKLFGKSETPEAAPAWLRELGETSIFVISATVSEGIDAPSLVAAISPDYYLETFSGYHLGAPALGSSQLYGSASPYNFDASAAGSLKASEDALSTSNSLTTLRLDFGSAVTAFGANIAATDSSGNVLSGRTVTLTMSDGSMQALGFPGFAGYTTSGPAWTWAEISVSGGIAYAQIDNVYAGMVPEPMALLSGLAASGLLMMRRRSQRECR